MSLLQDLRKTDLFRPEVEDVLIRPTSPGQAGEAPLTPEDLLWVLAPRGSIGVPIVGTAASEAAARAAVDAIGVLRREEQFGRPEAPPSLPAATAGTMVSALPDWRLVATGFAFGVFATVVGGYQWIEWKKRRRPVVPSQRQPVG